MYSYFPGTRRCICTVRSKKGESTFIQRKETAGDVVGFASLQRIKTESSRLTDCKRDIHCKRRDEEYLMSHKSACNSLSQKPLSFSHQHNNTVQSEALAF